MTIVVIVLELGVIVEGLNVQTADEDGENAQAKLTWLVYEPVGVTVNV